VSLKAIIDKLDTIPEAQRALYVERDGKFMLDVEAASAEEAFASGLKRNRDETLRELAAAKKKLAAWDGVDPEEYKKLRTSAEEAERKKATAEGDFKSLEKQLVDRHAVELKGKDERIGKLNGALERHLVQAELRKVIAARKGMADMTDLLVEHGARFVRVRETDDGFAAVVTDERGNPRIADGKGTPMSLDAYVEQELMTKFPRAFEGTGSSGGGASKSTAGGGGGSPSTIAAGDTAGFLKNLAGIAKGDVKVQ
jgi:hypothetical protein